MKYCASISLEDKSYWFPRIKRSLESFKESDSKYEYDIDLETSAENILCAYVASRDIIRSVFIKRDENNKPIVDRHKIISLFELVITMVKPLTCKEDKDSANALFAFSFGLFVLKNWEDQSSLGIDRSKINFSDTPFKEEHISWLKHGEYVDKTRLYPSVSNAMTWYLFEKFCFSKAGYNPELMVCESYRNKG